MASLGRFHSQEEAGAAVCLGKNSAENGNVQTIQRGRNHCKPNKTRAYLLSPDKKLECVLIGFSHYPSFLLPLLFGSSSPPTFDLSHPWVTEFKLDVLHSTANTANIRLLERGIKCKCYHKALNIFIDSADEVTGEKG